MTPEEIREEYLTDPIYNGNIHECFGGMSVEISQLREYVKELEEDIQEYVDAQPPI